MPKLRSNKSKYNLVATYQSSTDESEQDEEEELALRKPKRTKSWRLENTYTNKQDAIDFVKAERTWSISFTNNTSTGSKVHYRCNKVSKGGEQCDTGLYLHYENTSFEVDLYRASSDHNCTIINKNIPSQRLNHDIKKEIDKLSGQKQKPKQIFESLKERGFPVKNITQINNHLQVWRKARFGPTTISLGEIEEWCINNSTEPVDDDESYVFAYHVQYPDEENEEGNHFGGASFQLAITTPRLLSQSTSISRINVDATYKLNWEGMPVLVIGTTDMNRHFHPIAISISSDETKSSFEFLFQSLQSKQFSPSHLVCDASGAIREAFSATFPENVRITMCWAHTRRNISKHINLCSSKENQVKVMEDIDLLQLSPDSKTFAKAKDLFCKKWKDEIRLVDYLCQMWFSSHDSWYEGYCQGPSTNNALESLNLVIKKEEMLRERMPLSQFTEQTLQMTKRWSKQYTFGKEIATEPSIELCDCTQGYQWAKCDKDLMDAAHNRNSSNVTYYCPTGNKKTVTKTEIRHLTERKWTTFDEFKIKAFVAWIVEMNNGNWKESSCTCPQFLKLYKCKHILGIAIRLKFTKPPAAAKQIPIEQKQKRGRPKKTTKALLID